MRICIYEDKLDLGLHAARVGAEKIREAIAIKGYANIILATGASQFEMLENLVGIEGIAWDMVEVFHLDEYVGISETHPASFRKYLKERFEQKVSSLKKFHYINADSTDLTDEVSRISKLISERQIDVAFIGIGENGHLAFNDPPADLTTDKPYLVVALDEACRRQQVGEGWFKTMSEVPTQALSMSIPQILASSCIVCTVPDARKAFAVNMAVHAPISPQNPCASLRAHADCYVMVDFPAARMLLDK
jgi:glucosamine-6-phosphate deaminase